MSCHCVSCVSSFRFSTQLAAVNQQTSSESLSPHRAAGSHSSLLVCYSDCRNIFSDLAASRCRLISPPPPRAVAPLFLPSQGQHQSERLPLAAPFSDFPPSGWEPRLSLQPRQEVFLCVYILPMHSVYAHCHARACVHTGMHVHFRKCIMTCKTHTSPQCTIVSPKWTFFPTQAIWLG